MSQTIDTIFLSHAEKKGDQLALTDTPGRERLGLTTISQLSYLQAKRYVINSAAYFRQFQFAEGDVVIVQMPNIAETPLIMLALLNAGLVPCLIPPHWRRVEIDTALQNLKPRAIISHQSTPDYNPFASMFEIAANHASIRFVFGLGDDLPDGVSPLPPLTETITTDLEPVTEKSVMFSRSSEQVAFIGWSRDIEGNPHPVAYTHIQLMANHHLLSEQISLEETPALLSFYAPTSLNGLVTTFIPWIIEGGALHIASNLKLTNIIERIEAHNINLAIIPQTLQTKLSAALTDAGIAPENQPKLALISPTPYHTDFQKDFQTDFQENDAQNDEPQPALENITTIYNLNGLCLFPLNERINQQSLSEQSRSDKTRDTRKGLMQLGPQPGKPNANGERSPTPAPPFIETRIQGAAQKASEDIDGNGATGGNGGTDNFTSNSILQGRLELSGLAIGFTSWQSNITTAPLSNFDTHWEKTHLTAALVDQAMSLLQILPTKDAIYYGSTQFSGQELDKIYQTYPGFIDAAAFSIKDPILGERLCAAIIPQPGTPLSYEDFKQHLLNQEISPAKIPEKLVTVVEIPRSEDGMIKRQAILSRSA